MDWCGEDPLCANDEIFPYTQEQCEAFDISKICNFTTEEIENLCNQAHCMVDNPLNVQIQLTESGDLCAVPYNEDSKDYDNELWTFNDLLKYLQRNLHLIICMICGIWRKLEELEQMIQDSLLANVDVEFRTLSYQTATDARIIIEHDGTFTLTIEDNTVVGVDVVNLGRSYTYGKINFRANVKGNTMNYIIDNIFWNYTEYIPVQTTAPGSAFALSIRSIDASGSTNTTILDRYQHTGKEPWRVDYNNTIPVNIIGNVAPGTMSGWRPFIYYYDNASVADDEGEAQIRFNNNNKTNGIPIWDQGDDC